MNTTEINRHNTKVLSKDEPLTEMNIRFRGERTAVRAAKTFLCRENSPYMQKTYCDLLKDIDNFGIEGYVLTESYEIVQEAVLFFCNFMGQRLTDTYIDNYGQEITILKGCFRAVNCFW